MVCRNRNGGPDPGMRTIDADKAIAGLLNRIGKRTGRLNGWTQSRVRGFRNRHEIAVYVEGEWAERGEITLSEAAKILGLSALATLRKIHAGVIPADAIL